MRRLLVILVVGGALLTAGPAPAQPPPESPPRRAVTPEGAPPASIGAPVQGEGAAPAAGRSAVLQAQLEAQQKDIDTLLMTERLLSERLGGPPGAAPEGAAAGPGAAPPGPALPAPAAEELRQARLALAELRQPAGAPQAQGDEQLKKQIELQRKQIEVLDRLVKLLAAELEKQGPAVARLQTQVATLEARARQAAQRDQDIANGLDNLAEHVDAAQRYGPELPAFLKQLFLVSGTNETPLSIYGSLAFGYNKIIGDSTTAANGAGRPSTPGGFYFGEFSPDFLLKLNDWIFLEAEVSVNPSGAVTAGAFAQADFFVADWLTISAGRFVAPIGWYNLRLNNPWVNKLPADAPGGPTPLWLQVLPPLSMLGVQAQGSFYLGCSPVKMEYNAYVSNGLNLTPATPGAPTINELANLENMQNTFTRITNEKAVGGRLGLWWPEGGLAGGLSGLYNGDYVAGGSEDSISLWAVDLNYRKGNWDLRAEYGMTYQHAQSFIANNIRRQGFYVQAAYRPYDVANKYLQNFEAVYRYSYVDFRGIDPTALDLATFATPIDVPVRRQQNEVGVNYYFYPRMVLKCAYQINDEPGFHLHDNQFVTELAWGW
jgi:hypothetical protein